jgi:hypothetical protein
MIHGHLDDQALLDSEELVFGGPVVGSEERFKVRWLVNDRRGSIAYESFAPGSTVNWAFWHDEVHVIMGGEAEIAYTLAPNHRKQVRRTFRKGDTYLITNGARLRFRVISDDPYLHVCVIMPRFEYSKDERLDTYE